MLIISLSCTVNDITVDSNQPELETTQGQDTPSIDRNGDNILFTTEEQLLFEQRYEEGYDLSDDRYSAWLQQEHKLKSFSGESTSEDPVIIR